MGVFSKAACVPALRGFTEGSKQAGHDVKCPVCPFRLTAEFPGLRLQGFEHPKRIGTGTFRRKEAVFPDATRNSQEYVQSHTPPWRRPDWGAYN